MSDMADDPDLDTPFGRLRWARQEAGYEKAADFARAAGIGAVTYRAYENGQNGFAKHAPDFAAKLGVSSDWLMRGGPPPKVPPLGVLVKTEVRGTGMSPVEILEAKGVNGKATPVPLVGSALGGTFEDVDDVEMTELRMAEILDYLTRPAGLADDPEAYSVEIVGDSMAPRFEPGEQVFVSPKATVRPGDDVIVQLVNPDHAGDMADAVTEVLIKRFLRRTGSAIELRQFNPPMDFTVPLSRIAHPGGRPAIHRVKGRP